MMSEIMRFQSTRQEFGGYPVAEQQALLYKKAMAEIAVYESKCKSKVRSDVKAQQDLQCTYVTVESDGVVSLQKQQFGTDIKGKLPIRITQTAIFSPPGKETSLFVICAENKSVRERKMIFEPGRLEKRHIRREFDRVGISFGFGEKKEAEVRKILVLKLLQQADTIELPLRHGWFQQEGEWRYTFPEKQLGGW